MKKLTMSLLLVVVFMGSYFLTNTANAQEKHDGRIIGNGATLYQGHMEYNIWGNLVNEDETIAKFIYDGDVMVYDGEYYNDFRIEFN